MLISMLAWVLRFGFFGIGNPGSGAAFLILSGVRAEEGPEAVGHDHEDALRRRTDFAAGLLLDEQRTRAPSSMRGAGPIRGTSSQAMPS